MVCSYPEAARERDLYRYYRPWLDAQSLENADGSGVRGLTYAGYRPKSSRDRSLTAFAQLATLRLNVRRCMVSLIDSHRQYILAEATQTVSLFTTDAERPEDEVWLGNAILNRFDAVCHHTFSSTYCAKEQNGEDYEAECMIIPDCRLDPRFADRDYVKGEPGVRFYCGVPIITRAGHRIGVYAVSDDKPRDGICAAEVRFMQDVAAAVMEHLELAKDSDDRSRGERMVRGLTQFIERSSAQDMREDTISRTTTMERQTENARLETLDEEDRTAAMTIALTVKQAQRKRDSESDTVRIFQRAARIIRQSTDADGVVFFDTAAAGIRTQLHEFSPSAGVSSDESATHNNTTDFDTADSTTSRKRRRKKVTFADDEREEPVAQGRPCPVAGLSLRAGNAALAHADFAFTESAMERYIHRYPYGKFFNYSEEGIGINSSDEKSQTSETEQSDRTEENATLPPKKNRKKREKFIPTEFLKVLPNVRTLIFLPLYDPSTERWIAGSFIWTTQAGRLMSPENELPFLQAFGNSVISEVARLSAQKADKAKTTFIASISHELRSPLHGILGSVEFLRDTVASTYQESLVSSIEQCGRVLLDTIEHVLDYAKINKLRSATVRRRQRGEGRQKRLPADNSILGLTTDFDLAQLVEEVCDTVCAGHTFRKTHNANAGAIYDQAENQENLDMRRDQALEEGRDIHGSVVVSLIVAPYVNWLVRSQPGALRRVVMNLLGNSLKYTESGHIAISLLQSNNTPDLVGFTLLVEDSGRGMSNDYQRTKLFSPFSQEDPFSSGTGLGLSIVKQIVESLGGDIEVQSEVNVGTQIRVNVRLPCGQPENAKQDTTLLNAPDILRNASVCIMTEPDIRGGERGMKTKASMYNTCQNFNMSISNDIDASPDSAIPDVDFLLTDSPSLDQLLAKPSADRIGKPLSVVCICTDTTEKIAVEHRVSRQLETLGWVAEVVTQPCGPRKLARAMIACRKRISQQEIERQTIARANTSQAIVNHTQSLTPSFHLPQRSLSDTVQQDPLAESHSPPPQLLHPQATTPLSPGFEHNEYFPPRVLLVDDNEINLKLLVVFAKRQNLRYAEATNGLEALEIYKREANTTDPPSRPFDFILMDVSMPIMDGLTSTRQIRAFEQKAAVSKCQIVALTGLASAQDQQDAQDAGVDTYLVKPVKFGDIKRVFGTK